VLVLLAVSAQAQNWTNGAGDNLWQTAGNWDASPAGANAVVNLSGPSRAIVNADTTAAPLTLKIGDGSTGELEMTGGTLLADGNNPDRVGSSGGNGLLNISGGTATMSGNRLQVGLDTGSIGVINLSGGTLISGREYNGYSILIGDKGTGEVNLTGGTLLTRAGVNVGLNGGHGTFAVIGSGISEIGIGAQASLPGRWNQASGSVLKLRFDEGGITPIHIDNENAGSDATFLGEIVFADGALLDVGFADEELTGTWTVMTWDEGVTVTDNGLRFAEGTPLYKWSFDLDEANHQLTVTATEGEAPANKAPTPTDDTTAVGVGRSIPVEVLRNDSDPDGDPISLVSVGTPSQGSIVIDGDRLLYTAPSDFVGTATVEYTISDGEWTATANLSVKVGKFAHPGVLHTRADLDRMRAMVSAGKDPWYSSFVQMQADPLAQYDYVVQKNPNDDTLARENPCHQCSEYREDARAAYLNALMWYITGDERHAQKAVEILNAWSSLNNFYGGGTEPLSAGLFGAPLIYAAEIIRYTYDGWADADIQAFEDMLVYPGYSTSTVPAGVNSLSPDGPNVTFYWRTYMGDPARFGNQGLLAWKTVMAIGIFLDNEIIYDRALNYITGQPHRADDLPYASGPAIASSTPNDSSFEQQLQFDYQGMQSEIEDYGYDDQIQWYIRENGQSQEASRDQAHVLLGVSTTAEIAQIAWGQGDDVFGYLDQRILKGLEYAARYNISYLQSYSDQPEPWEPTVENGQFIELMSRSGRWKSLAINPYLSSDTNTVTRGSLDPTWELPLAHYKVRLGLPDEDYKWTERAHEYYQTNFGYEDSGYRLDQPGWGGLTFHRPATAAGDPIVGFDAGMPVYKLHSAIVPIAAANYDYFAGDGNGHTYFDTTDGNSGGAYREGSVDIAEDSLEGYYLTDLAHGEWLTYTIDVPQPGDYLVMVRYAAAAEGGKIRFSFDGQPTEEIALPSTGAADTFTLATVIDSVPLEGGAQVMRIEVTGESDLVNLSSIQLGGLFGAPVNVAAEASYNGTVSLSWSAIPNAISYSVKRSTTQGGPYETIASGLTDASFVDAGLGNDATYYYVVTASDGTNESEASTEISATTWTPTSDDFYNVIAGDRPVVYWPFNETGGRSANAAIGGVRVNFVSGPNLSTGGVLQTGIGFTGGSWAQSDASSLLNFTDSFSLSFWIKPRAVATGTTGYQGVLDKGSDAYRVLRNMATNTLRFAVLGGDGGDVEVESTYVLPDNLWTHVAAVYDADAGEMQLFFNGQQDSAVASRFGSLGSNSYGLTFAAQNNEGSYSQYLDGELDEVSVYDHALSAEQVHAQFEIGDLLMPSTWRGYPVDDNMWAETGSWLGWLYIEPAPWVWTPLLNKWLWVDGEADNTGGAWIWIQRSE